MKRPKQKMKKKNLKIEIQEDAEENFSNINEYQFSQATTSTPLSITNYVSKQPNTKAKVV